jgi:hypothetical protein
VGSPVSLVCPSVSLAPAPSRPARHGSSRPCKGAICYREFCAALWEAASSLCVSTPRALRELRSAVAPWSPSRGVMCAGLGKAQREHRVAKLTTAAYDRKSTIAEDALYANGQVSTCIF